MKAGGTIVVIGGSSGIGLAVARRSLDDGATVVIAGRSQRRLDAARADWARTGPPAGRLSAHPVDIGDPAQVARLFERVGTLSHLVVTAADLPYGPAVTLSEDSILRAVRSKILGPLFAAQQAAPRITEPAASPSPRASPPPGPRPGARWPLPSTARSSPWSWPWRSSWRQSASTTVLHAEGAQVLV